MSFDANRIYELLPAVYRIRDAELAKRFQQPGGKPPEGPLKALLSVIAEQAEVLQEDLEQLYDDLFIETCSKWVVPYIGDLVGARRLFVFPGSRFTERAFVANTMAYRRRKGTAAVVEQLARDVTGWNANVVEYFQLLATTQYMNHNRPENLSIAGIRRSEPLEFISTPFDKVPHTADVRRIASRRGKYNIPNIGIYLWRINNYSITNAPAFKVDDRRYLFDALGKDTQLYNNPETEDEITHLAEPINVAMPITRRVLARNLKKYYGVEAGDQLRSILINRNGVDVLLPTTATASPPGTVIDVCDLSDITDPAGNVIGWAHKPEDRISLDPVLGRLAFPENDPPPRSVHVTYNYGFSAEMGGGEYKRGSTFSKFERVIRVPQDEPTLQSALAVLTVQLGTTQLKAGVIEIQKPRTAAESKIHELSGPINMPSAKAVEIRGADQHRPVIRLNGDLLITGAGSGELLLNGLLITGGTLRLPSNSRLRLLRFTHCTIAPRSVDAPVTSPPSSLSPAAQSLLVESPDVSIELNSSISGPIGSVDGAHVSIHNSIVDAGDENRVAYADVLTVRNTPPSGPTPFGEPGGPLKVVNSTIIGKVNTLTMDLASNAIFFADLSPGDLWPAPVHAERLQAGCVRFSYVPPGSRLPRLYRCQPADPADAGRVEPIFTSLRYGDAGYCQLSLLCAEEIRQGADDQAEMGAFHDLYQPQREANLSGSLSEYLRFGLEAGIFFAS